MSDYERNKMKKRGVFEVWSEDCLTAREHQECGEGSIEVIELSRYKELLNEYHKAVKTGNYYLECMKGIRNRIHVNDKDQIENNLNEAIRELYRK